jgi:dienelactone hydrolase
MIEKVISFIFDRWVLIVLLGLLLYLSCSHQKSNGDPTVQPMTMVSFSCEYLEIAGAAPANWIEITPGTFKRNEETTDKTILIQDAFPKIDFDWFLKATILPRLGLNSIPRPSGTHQTSMFKWRFYKLEKRSENIVVDLGLAKSDTHTYIIFLLCNAEEYAQLHQAVFLPVLDALEVTPGTSANSTIYEDNLHLFTYDTGQPLDVQEISSHTSGGITTIQLTYVSPKGGLVPATLMVPEGAGPFPGLLMMHGMPSHRGQIVDRTRRYARAGVVVMTIDAPFSRPGKINRPEGAVTFTPLDREEQIQLMIDLRRAVDLLSVRPEVNPDQLVYVGLSYGGAMAGLFAGLEDRLKAYVIEVGDGGLVSRFTGFETAIVGFYCAVFPHRMNQWYNAMWPIESLHYAAKASPASMLFQVGRFDINVTPAEVLRYQAASSEPKQVIWYNSNHGLPAKALYDQAQWLSNFIPIDLDAY